MNEEKSKTMAQRLIGGICIFLSACAFYAGYIGTYLPIVWIYYDLEKGDSPFPQFVAVLIYLVVGTFLLRFGMRRVIQPFTALAVSSIILSFTALAAFLQTKYLADSRSEPEASVFLSLSATYLTSGIWLMLFGFGFIVYRLWGKPKR